MYKYMGTQSHFQIDSTIRHGTKTLTNNRMLGNEKANNAKLIIQERLVWKNYEIGLKIHEVARGKGPLP